MTPKASDQMNPQNETFLVKIDPVLATSQRQERNGNIFKRHNTMVEPSFKQAGYKFRLFLRQGLEYGIVIFSKYDNSILDIFQCRKKFL